MDSIRSRCEWNVFSVVKGTLRRYSTMNPSVTSSGNLIKSPTFTKRPLLARGIIFIANARLIQKPAPPVANHLKIKSQFEFVKWGEKKFKLTNLIFWFSWLSLDCFLLSKLFIACGRNQKKKFCIVYGCNLLLSVFDIFISRFNNFRECLKPLLKIN